MHDRCYRKQDIPRQLVWTDSTITLFSASMDSLNGLELNL